MATEACECRHKDTPRDDAFQDNIQKRLNRAIGQLGGVKAMIDDNRYCGDVLLQLAAAVAFVLLLRHLGYLTPNLYVPFFNVTFSTRTASPLRPTPSMLLIRP